MVQFPIIKKISAKLLSDEITSLKPMSLEEAAKGREIKQYDNSYNSIDEIKDFIIKKVVEYKGLNIDWVDYKTYHSLPFNLDKNIYYIDRIGSLGITCYKPTEHILDHPYGIEICTLDPRIWSEDDIKKVITELKN